MGLQSKSQGHHLMNSVSSIDPCTEKDEGFYRSLVLFVLNLDENLIEACRKYSLILVHLVASVL